MDATAAEREAIPVLAERALEDGRLTGNPRLTDINDMKRILERAFDGVFGYDSRVNLTGDPQVISITTKGGGS